jgi:hypothetical protein
LKSDKGEKMMFTGTKMRAIGSLLARRLQNIMKVLEDIRQLNLEFYIQNFILQAK